MSQETSQDRAFDTAYNISKIIKSWGFNPRIKKCRSSYHVEFVVYESKVEQTRAALKKLWGNKASVVKKRGLHTTYYLGKIRVGFKSEVKKSTTKKRSTKKTSTKKPSKPTKPKARTKRKTTTRKTVKKKKKNVSVKKMMKCIFSSS